MLAKTVSQYGRQPCNAEILPMFMGGGLEAFQHTCDSRAIKYLYNFSKRCEDGSKMDERRTSCDT